MTTKISSFGSLFNQRHTELKNRLEVWKLVYDSYLGGTNYILGNYLHKYPKESQGSFGVRKKRAVYFNQLSPIVDMMSGLLFLNEPIRSIPKELSYLQESVSGDKKINEFMRLVAAHSFMFTCGVLVDSPEFDPSMIATQRDRVTNKINPYAVMYLPFKIRDFNINVKDGMLDWVLLDNSYYDHSNPFDTGQFVTKYTLWTREYHQDFIQSGLSSEPYAEEAISHPLGYVPFRMISWRDDNNDLVGESVCEDIALISRLIYNNMSYMDEMLASGTFKMLAYPSKTGDVPAELKTGGVGPLSVISYDQSSSSVPSFIGAELSGIDPFIKAINFYMAEILKKVGLSTDETKEFVKSGAAKKIDFQKMRALLVSGALMMGKTEEWIYSTAAKWEGKDLIAKSEYTSAFSDDDLQTEITMLSELLIQPIKSLRIETLNLMIKKLLANDLTPEKLDEIYADVKKNIGTGMVVETDSNITNNLGSKSGIQVSNSTSQGKQNGSVNQLQNVINKKKRDNKSEKKPVL